ncbi:MAG: DUF4838 domain-containing protein [Clostridia bacterium]|nr:DUF4838 domain-containing protein [Clostridia bacterium]
MAELILTPMPIVCADDASPVARTAAAELASFLAKITKKTFPILAENKYPGGPAILVNTKNIPFAHKADYEAADLGEEGIFYAIESDKIFFGGGTVRGVLYAVYTFLEDELGCHRYAEDCEIIPENESPVLTEKVKQFVPPMHYRAASFMDGETPDYTVFNKLNARTVIAPEFGGSVEFGIGFVHTLHTLIPDSLFDSHPEYFPLIDGKREVGPGRQRCLTNPEVLAMTIRQVEEDFRAHPDHKTASVSQADTGETSFVCTCPQCQKINDEEGSLMGTQLRFVNAVADAVRDEFPDRFIETLAYRFTRHIPKITRPRENVIIRLCSIECCFSHPIETCGHGGPAFVRDMCDWAEISDHIYIWDYVTNFAHYLAPQPNIPVLGPNMRFFVNHSTVGMFPEGAPDARGVEMSELKSWLLAKLEWDPDFNTAKGTEDFIRAYAGAGAEPILSYIRRLNERPVVTGSHRGCYAAPDKEFFSEDFMKASEEDFEKALSMAENDIIRTRIRRMQMPLRYVRMVLYPECFTLDALRREVKTFVAEMPELGISKIGEGGTWETSIPALESRIRWHRPDFTMQ